MSSLIAQTKAKLEAAKARLRFPVMESNLKRKQALLDQQIVLEETKIKREKGELSVDLELLAQQRETAALEAEADALDTEGLSSSGIALSFDGFGSISWYSFWFLSALSHFSHFLDFQLFRLEHH
jgi:hypothetical protein